MTAAAITVAIPTHDRHQTLLAALRSALRQTRPPAEVLVLADGCTDGTQQAVRELADPRVEVLDLPKGAGYGYGNRNQALCRARGDVVAWLGDDDLWLPDHLERVGALFDADVADIVAATACVVHPDGAFEATGSDWSVPFYRDRFMAGENRTPMAAVSHRAAPALAAGGWREEVPQGGDADLWRRLLEAGARPAASLSPTVLHLRASGRKQEYADRVRQNAEMARALEDPAELVRLRARAERAVTALAAQTEQSARETTEWARGADLALEQARADAQAGHAEARRVQDTLDAIQAGGWWRLRARLLALARPLRRR